MRDAVKKGNGEKKTMDVSCSEKGRKATGSKKDDDGSFPVKVQGAGVESFELQVHGFWLVQDAIMTVLGREEVAPRTSIALALSGVTLDPMTELRGVKGFKAGVTLRLVEEPYSPRLAQAHLARVQEMLKAAGPQDALMEGRSPTVLKTLTQTPEAPPTLHTSKNRRANSKTEQPAEAPPPPAYILPGVSDPPPLTTLLPINTHSEAPSYLVDLSLSCWNPPPGFRKLQGDFLYISVHTLEGKQCDITSCPRGFYLNRSTLDVFDPRPAQSTPVCHCLTDLLSHISPQFKHNLGTLRHRPSLAAEEMLPTPYRTHSWLGVSSLHSHRSSFSCRLGLDQDLNAQAPDWNKELQAARDLPQRSLEERLQRDRALLQVNGAFVWAVAQAAEKVIDGFVDPVNGSPEDPAFLCGGVFMSVPTHREDWLTGERGPRAAQRLELRCVQAYSDLDGDLQNLHTIPTAVADYRGVRLSAQGLAPGLQGPEQAEIPNGLLYGFSAGPLENPSRRKLLELLAQSAKALSLQRHAVLGQTGHQLPLFTTVDAQGILGADGRYYLLDVYRTMPADANFQVEEGIETEPKKGSFPRRYPHVLCRLRPELVKAFIQHKYSQFTQRVKAHMRENGGLEDCMKSGDSPNIDAVRRACKDVGSVSDIIFEMRFNPNIFSPGVQFPSSESDAVELQKRLLKEAASFIINDQIPAFMNDCIHGTDIPMDGASLRQALHQKGINLRYLGHLIMSISQSDLKHQLRHITRLVFAEIVVRCAQRFFSGYIQGVETSNLSAAASHFLCCLLVPHFSSASNGEESKKRSRRRGRGGGGASDSTAWTSLSGNELWSQICQDAQETYRLKEGLGSNVDHLVEQYGLQKMSLLREMCLKTGIQLRLREYILDNRNKAAISPDDVLNILPVVKHITMSTTDATCMFKVAQNSLQKGLLEQAYEQLKEAAYLFSRVCDDLHPEACQCLSLLAKVAYVQGHPAEARSVQLRVVVISERVLGFDHPNTIQQYVLLSVYLFAGGETALAQRCLYRAKVLLLTIHGGDHPYIAVIDASLGLALQREQSLQYLQSALKLNSSFRGDTDLTTALMHHLLAQRLCVAGDYRGGMNHEKEAYSIFQNKCGEDHPQTKCSSDFLRNITQQAVRVERSIRQGGVELSETLPEGLVPSQDITLEQLALVNGILKTSYSTKMMEFKEKLKERKAAEEAEKTKLENSESTNENKASELPTNSGEVTEEATSNGEPKQEATDGNAEGQTDASEKPDHSNMNGQIESHLHNGDCASKIECEEEEEEHQSNITNGVPNESQSKSSNIMTSVSEAQSESAVVNGKECVVNEGSGHLDEQAETE
ncbi:clustered mitochondria protein homolog [Rhinichthys klamathensis goyatoka]|uniref:clustered mitochondria protein homolog n=1 Tax=Rhinichthys klamathensis goyatoka TaxID=3034132 RepID=UPI0024B55FE7|nr:clustered mitochondria protein homolog [Rhinichthys klamathensis goyatoka]